MIRGGRADVKNPPQSSSFPGDRSLLPHHLPTAFIENLPRRVYGLRMPFVQVVADESDCRGAGHPVFVLDLEVKALAGLVPLAAVLEVGPGAAEVPPSICLSLCIIGEDDPHLVTRVVDAIFLHDPSIQSPLAHDGAGVLDVLGLAVDCRGHRLGGPLANESVQDLEFFRFGRGVGSAHAQGQE